MVTIKNTIIALGFIITVYACSPAGGEKPGHEFMPDMVHSTAYEANYYNYYYYNTWGSEDDYKKYAMPRKPVSGTIARGAAGGVADHESRSIAIPANGNVPYYYKDTEEERTRAMTEIVNNPFPITEAGLKQGKELYDIYCGICHGEKADGNGYLVRDPGGVYPNQPAILTSDEFITASNGRYYHAIVYGKNVMGAHADKLSYSERWEVIHYIRSLQAKSKDLEYSEKANTLNDVDIPGVIYAAMHASDEAHAEETEENHSEQGEHQEDGGHGHDH